MSSAASTARALLALTRANAVYWPTVAPLVRCQLRRWEHRARQIPDRRLRSLAQAKLRRERFHPLLAATLATVAPRRRRACVTEAIVALQVAYDYLDAVDERRAVSGERLDPVGCGDSGYARRLLASAREAFDSLPAAEAVRPVAEGAAERCREAQRLSHEAVLAGEAKLEDWARAQASGTGLRWPEFLAGAQASVLCLHALIAAAADPATDRSHAEALDALYLRIGALTMLDSVLDREEDLAAGELGLAARSGGVARLGERLSTIAHELPKAASRTPNASHHLMTATGIVAFYGSAAVAGEDWAEPAFAPVRRELGAASWATLALMRTWRAAARGTLLFRQVAHVAFVDACFWG
jgi:hypothetical protein